MATRNNELKAKQPATARRTAANVPAASRTATARKIEVAPDDFALDFETETAPAPVKKTDQAEIEARRLERQRQIAVLITKRDEYVDRLDTGAAKIEEARALGKDVSDWEDHWIDILRRYEKVCDKLRDLYAEA